MEPQSCKTCYFYRFDPIEDAMRGSCRHEPPKLVHVPCVDGQISLTAATPTVSQDWWCGKWQRIMQEWETANQPAEPSGVGSSLRLRADRKIEFK